MMMTIIVTGVLLFVVLNGTVTANVILRDAESYPAFLSGDVANRVPPPENKLLCLIMGVNPYFCQNEEETFNEDFAENVYRTGGLHNIVEESMGRKTFTSCRGLACKLQLQAENPEIVKQSVDFGKRQFRPEDAAAFYSGW
ncbi:uncharacterized protein LOC111087683 [Limulus polyphemus]|uniref:Uncharacterized protein LOC111087683 n=1 Tax=Limulus polyphemus TaxID=6850 RepID=A0ABM1T4S4_LIMPO|nr:uncharacterized protein LOC111087683 [Limulus polyphemus]